MRIISFDRVSHQILNVWTELNQPEKGTSAAKPINQSAFKPGEVVVYSR